jgi:hypothetical protein
MPRVSLPSRRPLLAAAAVAVSLASCSLEPQAAVATARPLADQHIYTAASAPSARSLSDNRERLFRTLAQRSGEDTCAAWSGMSASQKGVFLTTTDLLGKRVFIDNGDDARPDEGQLMVLDRVDKLYAVRGASSPGACGGGDSNRIYFSADRELMDMIRNYAWGLPIFGKSHDLKGPHDPFNGSRETKGGQPTGQMHFWKWDRVCTSEITEGCNQDRDTMVLQRKGVEGIEDPWIFELDIDYNLPHDSNPECEYGGKTGREQYEKKWWYKGKAWQPGAEGAGNAELDWRPAGC